MMIRHSLLALSLAALIGCDPASSPSSQPTKPAPAAEPAATAKPAASAATESDDWPTWGRTPTRNMASFTAKNLPATFTPPKNNDKGEPDLSTAKNIKWVAKMGSETYGNPTVAGGRVYIGTNNEGRGDSRFKGDYSVLKCLDEKTGAVIWELTVPKLGTGKVGDWEYLGICSSPTIDVEMKRVYLVTNRCEVLALDIDGLANGNDGPFQDEGKYMAALDHPELPAVEVKPTDADIVWRYDMREQLGVFPHNITSSAILVVGDRLYISTSNGVDWSHTNIPAPQAPALIALDRKTGEKDLDPEKLLVAEEALGISSRVLHGNWSSPTFGEVNGKPIIFFSGPDGYLYGFDTQPVKDADGYNVLKEIFRFDGNPKHYRFKTDDKGQFLKDANGKLQPIKYAKPEGPSEIIATPVFHKNRIYVAIGQDPEHGEGIGFYACIDATKQGNLSTQVVDEAQTTITDNPDHGLIWGYNEINRAISTSSIVNDLVFVADFSGFIYCFDAESGQCYWKHDTFSHIWGSPLVADGKVYIGNEDGDLTILEAGKEKKILGKITFDDSIYSSPITAGGVLYVSTHTHLYAIQENAGK